MKMTLYKFLKSVGHDALLEITYSDGNTERLESCIALLDVTYSKPFELTSIVTSLESYRNENGYTCIKVKAERNHRINDDYILDALGMNDETTIQEYAVSIGLYDKPQNDWTVAELSIIAEHFNIPLSDVVNVLVKRG